MDRWSGHRDIPTKSADVSASRTNTAFRCCNERRDRKFVGPGPNVREAITVRLGKRDKRGCSSMLVHTVFERDRGICGHSRLRPVGKGAAIER